MKKLLAVLIGVLIMPSIVAHAAITAYSAQEDFVAAAGSPLAYENFAWDNFNVGSGQYTILLDGVTFTTTSSTGFFIWPGKIEETINGLFGDSPGSSIIATFEPGVKAVGSFITFSGTTFSPLVTVHTTNDEQTFIVQETLNTYFGVTVDNGDIQQIKWEVPSPTSARTVGIGGMHYGGAAETAPVAHAGSDQTVYVGDLVTLDGSGSSDPDGQLPLTYAWSFISKPANSNVTLSDPSVVNPMFSPDVVGDYMIQLIVTDATQLPSPADTVTVSTVNSAPVADAGPDQAVSLIGTVVQLDGSQSYDLDGQSITYQWTISLKPTGSSAALDDPTAEQPRFTADIHGDYNVQLVVTDSYGANSEPDVVMVSFDNVAPVADAGMSQSAIVAQTVPLNGSGSHDANGDPLTYTWSMVSAPDGSEATIDDPAAQGTAFVPDLPGTYIVQLVVNDGFVDSDPATIQIEAVTLQTNVIRDIQNLQDVIANIDPDKFKNANMRNALLNKLNAVISNIVAGNYSDALDQLQNDVLGKTNGCAASSAPDKNDWILTCDYQTLVYTGLLAIISQVETL